jgi:very-short-patch-repair endonuclease
MTKQEVCLWWQLRQMRPAGFHFRRQAPMLGFYLDFVCFKHRLIIEVDGSQHGEDLQADHDAVRDTILRKAGFRTLRVWNSDVDSNLDGVMRAIQLALSAAPDFPTRPPLRGVHPPHKGEGRGVEE